MWSSRDCPEQRLGEAGGGLPSLTRVFSSPQERDGFLLLGKSGCGGVELTWGARDSQRSVALVFWKCRAGLSTDESRVS